MPYCGDTSLVKHSPGHRTVQLIRCRSWKCPDCVDSRKRQLIAEAIGGEPNTFLTLTVRCAPADDMKAHARKLCASWRKLRQRAMRKYKLKKLPFLAVMEATEAGAPHLHIMLRSTWLDQKWLSAQMEELNASPVVHIKRIDNKGRIAAYCAKYVGKAPHQFGTCKRYWKSRDFEKRPERLTKKEKSHGDRVMEPWHRIVKNWRTFNWVVRVIRHGYAEADITPLYPG